MKPNTNSSITKRQTNSGPSVAQTYDILHVASKIQNSHNFVKNMCTIAYNPALSLFLTNKAIKI